MQRRDPVPILARLTWTDGWATQQNVPASYHGVPYLFSADEAGSGGVELIDIADDPHPRVVNTIKLEINCAAPRQCDGIQYGRLLGHAGRRDGRLRSRAGTELAHR
ncbi:hypothetical protein [Nocardia abscessus]|uniref:hypothetical protein n=1 Tax=Nocardia abscessus TaxID=120957 RepID=UPI00245575D7|nr:hypothetical protein [Nocardia abscessus]